MKDEDLDFNNKKVIVYSDKDPFFIDDRTMEIDKMNKKISNLNEIFKDLSSIVEKQKMKVENIESKSEESTKNTYLGIDELRNAEMKLKSFLCPIL